MAGEGAEVRIGPWGLGSDEAEGGGAVGRDELGGMEDAFVLGKEVLFDAVRYRGGDCR